MSGTSMSTTVRDELFKHYYLQLMACGCAVPQGAMTGLFSPFLSAESGDPVGSPTYPTRHLQDVRELQPGLVTTS